jgi:hypothetical protein
VDCVFLSCVVVSSHGNGARGDRRRKKWEKTSIGLRVIGNDSFFFLFFFQSTWKRKMEEVTAPPEQYCSGLAN